ncbi:peptidoglycan-binding protein [Salicibibacter cibi]|uniref:Peptidoglycan-binding protein n=1 Tax=Salicibibacter cibi TaxID=2743001 RepID=A0A7T6ZDX0_9BACI|nr:peptidoglycan-binding protein [Salicibibacter cibi]QQK81735.1 peptidoglycan-binding protein [Salicibibacter cibi]
MKKYALSTVVAVGLLFAPNAADAFSVDADSMSEGDVNDSVNELQTELKDLGYFEGSTGSTFGPRTLSAVKAYQEDHSISSEAGNFFGVAGPQTIGSLEESSSSDESTSESTSSEGNSSSMSNGDTGEAVSDLQAQLQDLGYYDGNVDSIFGPQTESAVKAFQQDHGISSEAGNFFGVAGAATLSSLEGQPSENTGNNDNSEDNSSDNSSEESSTEDTASENNNTEESSTEDNTSENNNTEESSTEDTASESNNTEESSSESESSSENESNSESENSGSDNATNEEDNTEEVVDGASTDNNGGDASGVIDTAMAQMGTPYSYGANGPGAFDCSGFINYVLDQNGQGPDHRADTSSLYNMSTSVSNPSEGDLVFFDTSGGVSHAGIYIGNGEFIHASASNGVTIDSIDDPHYWGDKYIGAGSL